MKIFYRILVLMSLSVTGNVSVVTSQHLGEMPQKQRDSLLVAIAKEVVMKYGPDYYREYQPPLIEREQISPKGEFNPSGEMAGRFFYRVIFPYDKTQEKLEEQFAARVTIWEDTGKPVSVYFGNGWGREVREGWLTDDTIEPTPYEEMFIRAIYDFSKIDPNHPEDAVPLNIDELRRKGYVKQGNRGQWVKVRPDVPPHKRNK
jgi:hypothetical protein